MRGKDETRRGSSPRAVRLTVDGREVKLNGFVEDVFQETVVGLVRALGSDDEAGSIELTIGPAKANPGS